MPKTNLYAVLLCAFTSIPSYCSASALDLESMQDQKRMELPGAMEKRSRKEHGKQQKYLLWQAPCPYQAFFSASGRVLVGSLIILRECSMHQNCLDPEYQPSLFGLGMASLGAALLCSGGNGLLEKTKNLSKELFSTTE